MSTDPGADPVDLSDGVSHREPGAPAGEAAATGDAGPRSGLDPGEIQDAIRALTILTPNQRAAVLLHDLEGFTSPEVGDSSG